MSGGRPCSSRSSLVFERVPYLRDYGGRIHHHALVLMLLMTIWPQQKDLGDMIRGTVRQTIVVESESFYYPIHIIGLSGHEQPSFHVGLAGARKVKQLSGIVMCRIVGDGQEDHPGTKLRTQTICHLAEFVHQVRAHTGTPYVNEVEQYHLSLERSK